MKFERCRLSTALAVIALLTGLSFARAETKNFYLHDGDVVVFYGDSITEQSYYTQFVQLYTQTRYPHMHVRFFNAGIGGDKVSGGSGGPVDIRLSRDVIAHKPTVVTIMLGMNDGLYEPLNAEIASTYTKGYSHILDRLKKELPGVRITILGPSPMDEITRPELVRGGYNRSLVNFGRIDKQLAKQYDATFIDLHAPVLAAFKQANAIDSLAAELMVPDRVHPVPVIHWIMAEAILEGWNAPVVVASTVIDSRNMLVIDSSGSQVTDLTKTGNTVIWTELDDALPLPLIPNADTLLLRRISDVEERLNREPMKVLGLPLGLYKVSIDERAIGSFTDEELAKGINLAQCDTPMRRQAEAASWTVRDYAYANFIHTRLLIDGAPMGSLQHEADVSLRVYQSVEQQKIDDAVRAHPHHFRIEPDSVSARR